MSISRSRSTQEGHQRCLEEIKEPGKAIPFTASRMIVVSPIRQLVIGPVK